MEIDINYTFSFGKFKGETVKNILIGPTRSYLEWVITNFDDIIFAPEFLEDVINVNPRFNIEEKYHDKIHSIIENYKYQYRDNYDDDDKFNEYLMDRSYIKWLKLSDSERAARDVNYRQLCIEKLNQLEKNEQLKGTTPNSTKTNDIRLDGESYDSSDYIDDNYSPYSGTYAREVEGLSDDFIDDVLDGDADAYWNID